MKSEIAELKRHREGDTERLRREIEEVYGRRAEHDEHIIFRLEDTHRELEQTREYVREGQAKLEKQLENSVTQLGQCVANLFTKLATLTKVAEVEEPACPMNHKLKLTTADGEYSCDLCGKDILKGRWIFYCRRCDYSICRGCHSGDTPKSPTLLTNTVL